MNLISCPKCGVVLDLDLVKKTIGKYYRLCPVCKFKMCIEPSWLGEKEVD